MSDEELEEGTEGEGEKEGEEGNLPDDKAAEYLAGWKRALADYENLQKKNVQTRDDDRRRTRINLAQDILPVVDNFDQALKFAPKDMPESMKGWFAGVEHIGRQLAEALRGMGIEPIAAVGATFDPNLHESGGSRYEEGKPEHVVLEELIKGWKLGDVVIRPSKVIVNQQP